MFLGLPIFIKVPPSLATPVQGSKFQVNCQAEGFPRPMINWTRVGMPLPAGKTNINQGTLTINNLSPADNGFYDCVATNVMGTKKKRINLAVQVHRSGLYRHRLTLYIPNSIKGCFGNWALIQVCIKSAIYICLSKKESCFGNWRMAIGHSAFAYPS